MQDESIDDSDLQYPTVQDVLDIHETVVENDPETATGIENSGDVEYVVHAIHSRPFGSNQLTLHDRAFQLLRLLVVNHPFVDENKRTALNSTVFFYRLNGYQLRYGEDIESLVRLLAVDDDIVNAEPASAYLSTRAFPSERL